MWERRTITARLRHLVFGEIERLGVAALGIPRAREEGLTGVGAFGGGALDEDGAATRATGNGRLGMKCLDVPGAIVVGGMGGRGQRVGNGTNPVLAKRGGVRGKDGGEDVRKMAECGDHVAGCIGRGGFELSSPGENNDGMAG